MLFRFYDPRVLRLYLPTCTSTELEQVFGPVGTFFTEDAAAIDQLHSFDLVSGSLVARTAALLTPVLAGSGRTEHIDPV